MIVSEFDRCIARASVERGPAPADGADDGPGACHPRDSDSCLIRAPWREPERFAEIYEPTSSMCTSRWSAGWGAISPTTVLLLMALADLSDNFNKAGTYIGSVAVLATGIVDKPGQRP